MLISTKFAVATLVKHLIKVMQSKIYPPATLNNVKIMETAA